MQLKFLTLNMWHGHLLKEALHFLQSQDADIVALQEVSNAKDPDFEPKHRMLDILQENLRYPYYDFAPALIDNRPEGKIAQGNAVLSKFPITSRTVTFFNAPFSPDYTDEPQNYSTAPRNLEHLVLSTPAGELNVLNFQGVWDLDGDNFSVQRRNMSRIILEAIKGQANVILTGDSNARPTNQAIRDITLQLRDVFAGELTTTFNMRRKDNPGYADSIVDFIFVSPHIKVLSHACPDVDISDHLPLTAQLQIESPRKVSAQTT